MRMGIRLLALAVTASCGVGVGAQELTYDIEACSARVYPRPPVTTWETASCRKNLTKEFRLSSTSGGAYRVAYDYRARLPVELKTVHVFCDVDSHSNGVWLARKRIYHVDTFPMTDKWFAVDTRVDIPAGADAVTLVYKLEDGGDMEVANVEFRPYHIEERPEIEFKLMPGGYLDNRFAIGAGQVGLVQFGWRSRVHFNRRCDTVRAVIPKGFELVDMSWADPDTLVRSSRPDGSLFVEGKVRWDQTVVGNWYHRTDLAFLVRATEEVGAAGKMSVVAFADGRERSGGTEIELFTIPKMIVPQAKRYFMGCNHGEGYWLFPTREGNEAYAEFLKEMGVTWLMPPILFFEGRQDLYDLWRSKGVRYITPEQCEYLADGYMIGRSKERPEGDRFVSDGDARVERHEAACPVSVYEERPFFLTNVVPRLRKMLKGADGMWCNWEPWSFCEHGCFCTNCCRAFATYLQKPYDEVAYDWPKCIQKDGRFYDRKNDFRCLEHGKIVRTLQKHIKAMTGGERSLGMIPGVYWGELTEYSHKHDYPLEVKQRYYADCLDCINGWGPYEPHWSPTQEPYRPLPGLGVVSWLAAKSGRGTMTLDYGEKCPKLLGMSCGCAYVMQPEWFENMLDATFFNGWYGNAPWWYPMGADGRLWQAYQRSAEKVAKYEDIVLDGRRIDAKVMVRYAPGTERRYPYPERMFLPHTYDVSLVQHAAYELGDRRIVAVINYDESPADVDIVQLDAMIKERRRIPASKCLVFEYVRPKDNPVAATLAKYVDARRVSGVISVLSDADYNLTVDCAGWADCENLRPMRLDTVFAVFSMSKTLFGAAMMCAIDEKRISLDDPVSKYLPEFADVKMRDGAQPRRPLLVRDMCCHVNGFRGGYELVDRDIPQREVARRLAATPLETQPGDSFSYGTATIDSAAACLEVAVGKPYEIYLKEKVLDPLGMIDTTFAPNEEQQRRMVRAYSSDDKGLRPAADNAARQVRFPKKNPLCAAAGGGLFSTAKDMIRFSQMLAHHGTWKGREIISRKTFDKVFAAKQTPAAVKEPYSIGSWIYGDWFGHEGAARADQRANLRTGHSRIFLIQTENKAGSAFFELKRAWHRACDGIQGTPATTFEN